MIGTSVDNYLGGGGPSGVLSLEKTILADGNSIQDNTLIGATKIVSILSTAAGVVNKGYAFDTVTGTITNYAVLTGEIHTILYNKP